MQARILIIEDEAKLARVMELELERDGYETVTVNDGTEGLETALAGGFNLIVLDLMLPGINGMEICRKIRQRSMVPIVMITARDDTMDKVAGLDTGADDYITKPFAMEEFLARIRSALRRNNDNMMRSRHNNIIEVGRLMIDESSRTPYFDGKKLELTKREYDLLKFLAMNYGIVLTRDKILENVWSYEYYGETNVVDVYIRYLRSKIDDVFNIKLIHTMRGVGYMLKQE